MANEGEYVDGEPKFWWKYALPLWAIFIGFALLTGLATRPDAIGWASIAVGAYFLVNGGQRNAA